MAIATGLISSLFNVASFGDMPFCQPQQLQWMYHGSTETYLCSPLYSIPFSLTTKVTICGMRVMASVQNLGKLKASRGTSYIILCLKC